MVEVREVSSIKIKTNHAGVKEYPFFTRTGKNGPLPDARCAIVLGKNGSGKSTIARALSDGENVEFFNKEGVLLGGNCDNVYVFDEWFIGENFRMSQEEVLESIFEIREHKPWWETISSIGKSSYPNEFLNVIRESIRNVTKNWCPCHR